MLENTRKFLDRNPIICSVEIFSKILSKYNINKYVLIFQAGQKNVTHETVASLLKIHNIDDQITALKNEANISDKSTFSYKLPSIENSRSCGIHTKIAKIIQPDSISSFEEFENQMRESIFDSAKNKPLGKARKSIAKPDEVNNISRTFGKSSHRSSSVYELIMPPKTPQNVLIESHQYKKEKIKRPYCTSFFDPSKTFGMIYKGDSSGQLTKDCMNYKLVSPSQICVISKIQGDYRERTKPDLGTSKQPDNDNIRYGVDDLIKNCEPCVKKKELYDCIAHLNGLRRILKNRKEINFYDLIKFIKISDPDNTGIIPKKIVFRLLANQNIFVNQQKINILLESLHLIDNEQNIRYVDFIALLDIKNPFPQLENIQDVPYKNHHYETTYMSFLNDHLTNPIDPNIRTSGIPSSRTDLIYPKKLSNGIKVNIGMLMDETSVETLISPSISTMHGLNHRDYFLPRNKEEIYKIFTNIGTDLSSKDFFEEQFNHCVTLDNHPDGLVCVDTFKKHINNFRN